MDYYRKIAAYTRVSTEDQAKVEEGSIKNQLAAIQKYVEGENLKNNGRWGEIVDVYQDEGFSGKNLERPNITRLLSDIVQGKVDTVIITEISRLSRSMSDWSKIQQLFDKNHVSFVSLRQNFDTSNAFGRCMVSLAMEFSQLERELTVERTKASCYARMERGLFQGGPIPYGYVRSDKVGHLKVVEGQRIIANEIFNIFINQAGYLSQAVNLIRELSYERSGGKSWTKSSLCRWIKNRALIAEVEINRKNIDKVQERLNPNDRYKIVQASWEPLIDRKLWEQANQILKDNYRKLKVPNWKHGEFLLSGIMECPLGSKLSGASGYGRSGKKFTQYRHSKKCNCHFHSVPVENVNELVFNEIKRLITHPKLLEELVTKANEDVKQSQPDLKLGLSKIKIKYNSLINKLDLITDELLFCEGQDQKNMWQEKANRLQQNKYQLELEMKALEVSKEQRNNMVFNLEELKPIMERFNKGFNQLPQATKAQLIKSIVHKVVVQKDRLEIFIKGPSYLKNYTYKKDQLSSVKDCGNGEQIHDYCLKWGG